MKDNIVLLWKGQGGTFVLSTVEDTDWMMNVIVYLCASSISHSKHVLSAQLC